MDANEYQKQSMKTMNFGPYDLSQEQIALLNCVYGLVGETGEIADLFKKIIFHGHVMDIEKVAEEVGDLCWYVQALCSLCGLDLGAVLSQNVDKLKKRYPDGFNQGRSINRDDQEYSVSRRDKIMLCPHNEIDLFTQSCKKCEATIDEIDRINNGRRAWIYNG